jgi:hypothetical protein
MDKYNVDKEQLKQAHSDASKHFKKTAEHFDEAAKQHDAGNQDKGNAHAYMAQGFTQKATRHSGDASKQAVGLDTNRK